MTAKELVDKIRYNIPEGVLYKQPDMDKQTETIQKLLDAGIDVMIVDKPIVYYNKERILLKTYIIEKYEIIIPQGTKAILIWCWYELPDGKQMINIGYVYDKNR